MKYVCAENYCIARRAGVIFCAVGLRWVPIWNGRREGFLVSAVSMILSLFGNFPLFWVGVWRGPAAQRVAFARPVMEWSLVCIINMHQIIRYYVDICLNFNVLYVFYLHYTILCTVFRINYHYYYLMHSSFGYLF